MTGTSGRQRASSAAISSYSVIIPSNNQVWSSLDAILSPLFARVAANATETQSLAATRDLLLPKLISGEIRVKDAEDIVGAAR
jgi:type I restriction enzyme S subunit